MEKGKSTLKLSTNSRQRKAAKGKTVTINELPECQSPERKKDIPNLYKAVLKDSANKYSHALPIGTKSPSTRGRRRSSAGRKNSDEFEFHCSFDESDEENDPDSQDLASTQPITEKQILTGVVAFIEVRSNTENRFDGISKQMELLGATVVKKFIPEVTHVIFKDGKKTTRDKAIKKGIHLVTVLWVESCRQSEKRVSEDLFPVIVPDELHTPLPIGKLKRTKSMQPKSFEEDVRNSAEKEKKKRRTAARKATPIASPLATILCQDTQAPFSPLAIGSSLSPGCIPSTPLQGVSGVMDSPMDDLSDDETTSEKEQAPASDPTIKRLKFDDSSPTSSPVKLTTETKAAAKAKGKRRQSTVTPTSSPAAPAAKTPVIRNTPVDILQTGSGPLKKRKRNVSGKESDCSESEANPKNAKKAKPILKGKETESDVLTTTVENTKTTARGGNRKQRAKSLGHAQIDGGGLPLLGETSGVGVSSSDQEGKKKLATKRTSRAKKPQMQDDDVAKKDIELSNTGRDTKRDSGKKVPSDEGQDVCDSDKQASDSGLSLSDGETGANTAHVDKKKKFSKTASLIAKLSLSVSDKNTNSEEESVQEKEVSIKKVTKTLKTKKLAIKKVEEKSVAGDLELSKEEIIKDCKPKTKQRQRKKIAHSSEEDDTAESTTEHDETDEGVKKIRLHSGQNAAYSASSDETTESTEDEGTGQTTAKGKVSRAAKKKTRSKAQSKTKGETSRKRKPRRSLVLTSMHFTEQDIVVSVLRKLGGFYIADKTGPNTTHVIAGNPRRTLNVLLAIAQGCWLVSPEWVMKSLEAGYWIDEEPYELADEFPSAQLSRLERVNAGPGFRQELFCDVAPIFVAEDTSPPRASLIELITLCGGKVCTSIRNAGVCVGAISRRTEAINVTENWVIDSITEHTALSFNAYALNSPARSRKEGSPSY